MNYFNDIGYGFFYIILCWILSLGIIINIVLVVVYGILLFVVCVENVIVIYLVRIYKDLR